MIKDDDKVKYVTIINLAIAEVPEFGNLFHRFKRTMPVLGRSELLETQVMLPLWHFILENFLLT
jgi:hypothetical protein